MDRVLVTGVSGYLGSYVARELLERGYRVRGSVRTPSRGEEIRTALAESGTDVTHLELCRLDLLEDAGWPDAVADCRYVLHIASPFVLRMPKHDDELVRPAVEGTRRALGAALASDVERVVVTSSIAAIGGGHTAADPRHPLGPDQWTNLESPRVTAYPRSKTLAERTAWAVMEEAGRRDDLCVVNPGTIAGPLLSDDPGTSLGVIQQLLDGAMPLVPELGLPWVDVRDVAEVHVLAMEGRTGGGTRTIVANPPTPLPEIARILRAHLGPEARRVPRRRLPAWATRALAVVDPTLRDSRAYIGRGRHYDAAAALALLGRPLRTTEEAVLAAARSLLERSLAGAVARTART
ncbi:NAD-dependent epimerase/dehydratase family protein [Salana multivorans]